MLGRGVVCTGGWTVAMLVACVAVGVDGTYLFSVKTLLILVLDVGSLVAD